MIDDEIYVWAKLNDKGYKKKMTYHTTNHVAHLWKTIRFNHFCK